MTVRLIFGGIAIRKPGEDPIATHPEGKPVPSYDKFYYRLVKEIGRDAIRGVFKGTQAVEYDAPTQGSYFDGIANIGEIANYDSSHVKEYPRRYVGAGHLPALQVVRMTDGADRQHKGIGFSLNGENSESYSIANFVAANKKSVIGRIFGVPIDDRDWPGHGLPVHLHSDRGPAITEPVRQQLRGLRITVEANRSYTSRDNAASEAKHPRRTQRKGAPEHKVSDLTVIDLIRRELVLCIRKNKTDDVSRAADDRAVIEGKVATPNDLHRYLSDRHRVSLVQISFEDSVRRFLTKVKFEVKKGLLYLKGREYSSSRLFESGLAKHLQRAQTMELNGYVVPFVTKFAWIEFKGQLVEIESKEQGDAAFASLTELEEIERERNAVRGRRRSRARVEVIAAQQDFKETTGKEWHANAIRKGTHKPSKSAIEEAKRLKATS